MLSWTGGQGFLTNVKTFFFSRMQGLNRMTSFYDYKRDGACEGEGMNVFSFLSVDLVFEIVVTFSLTAFDVHCDL